MLRNYSNTGSDEAYAPNFFSEFCTYIEGDSNTPNSDVIKDDVHEFLKFTKSL
ncbi:MAG: hypothetical protein UZ22_OP11002001157 [Microgenomates bacterium OLB23]|nr:MAG: hypothetical protein UZ22_OP11002001157 [Microgenomates bacterium OLB23]